EPQLFERMSASGKRFVSIRMEPLRDEAGNVEGVIAVSHDLTSHREQVELQARATALVAASGDAMTSTALDGTVLSWNEAAERIYGIKAEDIIGKHASVVAG